MEVSLRCDYRDMLEEGAGAEQGEATLILEVLRAKNLRPYRPGSLAKAAPSRMKGGCPGRLCSLLVLLLFLCICVF